MPPQRARKSAASAPRRRLSAEQRRESILLVARHAFAASGYEGVRTQDLAAVAGISEALLYQHFKSKADLYCEVARLSSDALREQIATAVDNAPESERLERGLSAFMAFVGDRSSGWPLLSVHVSDAEIAAYLRKQRAAALAGIVDLFAAESGATSTPATRRKFEQLAEVVAGGAEALSNWWAQNPKAKRDDDAVSLLTDIAREGLRSVDTPAAREGGARKARRRK